MKMTLIVAAVSALAATGALAQSSVTVYGRLNTSLEEQKNIAVNGNQSVMQNNASRLGFKGTEDLGGGLKADFLLEHRFNSDTGTQTGSAFWAGDAYVGLSGGFGAIKLGRLTSAAYYATADYISMHNHDTGTSDDKLYTYLGQNANTIAYTTPSLGGFTAEASISAGEGASRNNKVFGLGVNGAIGKLQLGFGYEKNDGDKDNQLAIRGLYEMGALTFGAYYQRSQDKGVGGLGNRDAYRVAAMYTAGASEFHVNVGMADDWSKLGNSDAKQYTVGYNYNLSKRTKVYAFYTVTDNGSNYSYFSYLGNGAVVNNRAAEASALALGVRHNF
ncbi:MAG: porin [Rubrivivax sp.]|nr:porin [Rubrivivax sp.]